MAASDGTCLDSKSHRQRPDILRQPLLPENHKRLRMEVLVETLKLIIGNTVLLGFVAAIMWACDAWDTRVFTVYVATIIVADMMCVLLDD